MTSTATQTGTVASPAIIEKVPFTVQIERELDHNEHWQSLVKKGEAQLEKTKGKSKTNAFDKIITRERDGTKFTIPTLIYIKPNFNFRALNSYSAVLGVKELAAQIAADGVRVPIKVFNEGTSDPKNYAEDGHRRMTALKWAILDLGCMVEEVPVRRASPHANDKERVFSQYADNTGVQPTPFEAATLFARLISMGMTEEDIARRTGKGKSRVISLLEMASVPSALQMLSQNAEIEISDSFIHSMFKANDKNAEKTMSDLETAIEKAKLIGAERVMPKHLNPAANTLYNNFTKPSTRILQVTQPQPTLKEEVEEEKAPEDIEATAETGETQEIEGEAVEATSETGNDAETGETKDTAPVQNTNTTKPASNVTPLRPATTPQASAPSKPSTPAAPAPQPSVHTQRPTNYTVRLAMLEFLKENIQFLPMVDGEKFQRIKIVNDEVDLERALAIRHGYGLDAE